MRSGFTGEGGSGNPWPVLLWALGGALLPGAPPSHAQAPRYAVGRIVALGGEEIRGNPGGALLDRRFGSGCKLPPVVSLKPLAAALTDQVGLQVEMIACPAAAPLPVMRCRTRIGEIESPWATAEAGKLVVPVPLPDTTGVYRAELDCEAGGNALPELETTLYVTYAKPRPLVKPPSEDMYRRACTWGRGFRSDAPERDVMDQALRELYTFGQRKWRYALCEIDKDGLCVVGATRLPVGPLDCDLPDSICKCDWPDLLSGLPERNFSDCYQFSAAFSFVAATMGIGGLVQDQVFGDFALGFFSRSTARSLDPTFPGNLLCGDRQAPCAYLFANHDLVFWGDRIYDPTFGGIYTRLSELIGQSVSGTTDDGNGVFAATAAACFSGNDDTNNWMVFRELPAGKPRICGIGSHQDLARFDEAKPQLRLQPVPGRQGQALVVTVSVDILKAGTYVVTGRLFNEDGTKLISRSASRHWSLDQARAIVSGEPGRYPASLVFSGNEAAKSGDLGPYTIKAQLMPRGKMLGFLDKLDEVLTERISPDALSLLIDPQMVELAPAEKLQLQWVIEREGLILRATLPAIVSVAGEYLVDARLAAAGNQTLAYGSGRFSLTTGLASLTVDFPFRAPPPVAGPWLLSLALYSPGPPSDPFDLNSIDGLLPTPVSPPPLPERR